MLNRLAPRHLTPSASYLEALVLTAVALAVSCLWATSAAAQTDADEARTKALARLAAAERTQGEGDQLRQHADYSAAEARDANLSSTWQRAEQLLQTARDAMGSAEVKPSASAFRDAGILANGSRRAYEDFAERARRSLRAVERERNPPPPPPPTAPPPPPPAPSEGPAAASPAPVAPPPQASPEPSAPKTEPPRSQDSSQGSRRLQSAPPPLRQAIEAFFQGDDAKVLETLGNPQNLGSGVQRAHALMLRAAARYHLYLLGGERDYAQRSAAVEDVLSCRRLAADLTPQAELFSPRFVDFFNGTQ